MYDVITIGGAVRDFTFYIKEGEISNNNFIFPLDSKILVSQAYFTNGGGANNVAVGLARFGLKVALVGRIGNDFSGQAILKKLKKNKINTRFVQIDPKLHTGVSVIIQQEKKGKTIFTYRGANENLQITNLNELRTNTKWIYIAALTGQWRLILNKIFSTQSKSVGPSIAWNPGSAQLAVGQKKLAKFLKQTVVLILNQYEAAQLVLGNSESKTLNTKQIIKLLKSIYKLGPKIIVITAGRRGAYVYNGQKIYYHPSVNPKPKDTTGAGDAFSSGFLAGLIIYKDIKKALRLGILNSGSVIKKIGAQEGLLDKRVLKEL